MPCGRAAPRTFSVAHAAVRPHATRPGGHWMIASLALMLMGAAAALPCEGLTAVKLEKATITSVEMVPEGLAPVRGGGQGRGAGAGQPGRGGAGAGAPAAAGAELNRGGGAAP